MKLTLAEFYTIPSLFLTYDISLLIHPQLDLFPELSVNGSFNKMSLTNIKLYNNKVSFKINEELPYSMELYHDRLVWVLGSMYYEDEPFMVLRNPSDQVDTYPNILISDHTLYRYAVTYLWSLMEPDVQKAPHPQEYQPLSGTLTPHALRNVPMPVYTDEYIERVIEYTYRYNRIQLMNISKLTDIIDDNTK